MRPRLWTTDNLNHLPAPSKKQRQPLRRTRESGVRKKGRRVNVWVERCGTDMQAHIVGYGFACVLARMCSVGVWMRSPV